MLQSKPSVISALRAERVRYLKEMKKADLESALRAVESKELSQHEPLTVTIEDVSPTRNSHSAVPSLENKAKEEHHRNRPDGVSEIENMLLKVVEARYPISKEQDASSQQSSASVPLLWEDVEKYLENKNYFESEQRSNAEMYFAKVLHMIENPDSVVAFSDLQIQDVRIHKDNTGSANLEQRMESRSKQSLNASGAEIQTFKDVRNESMIEEKSKVQDNESISPPDEVMKEGFKKQEIQVASIEDSTLLNASLSPVITKDIRKKAQEVLLELEILQNIGEDMSSRQVGPCIPAVKPTRDQDQRLAEHPPETDVIIEEVLHEQPKETSFVQEIDNDRNHEALTETQNEKKQDYELLQDKRKNTFFCDVHKLEDKSKRPTGEVQDNQDAALFKPIEGQSLQESAVRQGNGSESTSTHHIAGAEKPSFQISERVGYNAKDTTSKVEEIMMESSIGHALHRIENILGGQYDYKKKILQCDKALKALDRSITSMNSRILNSDFEDSIAGMLNGKEARTPQKNVDLVSSVINDEFDDFQNRALNKIVAQTDNFSSTISKFYDIPEAPLSKEKEYKPKAAPAKVKSKDSTLPPSRDNMKRNIPTKRKTLLQNIEDVDKEQISRSKDLSPSSLRNKHNFEAKTRANQPRRKRTVLDIAKRSKESKVQSSSRQQALAENSRSGSALEASFIQESNIMEDPKEKILETAQESQSEGATKLQEQRQQVAIFDMISETSRKELEEYMKKGEKEKSLTSTAGKDSDTGGLIKLSSIEVQVQTEVPTGIEQYVQTESTPGEQNSEDSSTKYEKLGSRIGEHIDESLQSGFETVHDLVENDVLSTLAGNELNLKVSFPTAMDGEMEMMEMKSSVPKRGLQSNDEVRPPIESLLATEQVVDEIIGTFLSSQTQEFQEHPLPQPLPSSPEMKEVVEEEITKLYTIQKQDDAQKLKKSDDDFLAHALLITLSNYKKESKTQQTTEKRDLSKRLLEDSFLERGVPQARNNNMEQPRLSLSEETELVEKNEELSNQHSQTGIRSQSGEGGEVTEHNPHEEEQEQEHRPSQNFKLATGSSESDRVDEEVRILSKEFSDSQSLGSSSSVETPTSPKEPQSFEAFMSSVNNKLKMIRKM